VGGWGGGGGGGGHGRRKRRYGELIEVNVFELSNLTASGAIDNSDIASDSGNNRFQMGLEEGYKYQDNGRFKGNGKTWEEEQEEEDYLIDFDYGTRVDHFHHRNEIIVHSCDFTWWEKKMRRRRREMKREEER